MSLSIPTRTQTVVLPQQILKISQQAPKNPSVETPISPLLTETSDNFTVSIPDRVDSLVKQMVDSKLFAAETMQTWHSKFKEYLSKVQDEKDLQIIAFAICDLINRVLLPTLNACKDSKNQEIIEGFIGSYMDIVQRIYPKNAVEFMKKFQQKYFEKLKNELAEACAMDIEQYACNKGNDALKKINENFQKIKNNIIALGEQNQSIMNALQADLQVLSKKIEQAESILATNNQLIEDLATQMHVLHVKEQMIFTKIKKNL